MLRVEYATYNIFFLETTAICMLCSVKHVQKHVRKAENAFPVSLYITSGGLDI